MKKPNASKPFEVSVLPGPSGISSGSVKANKKQKTNNVVDLLTLSSDDVEQLRAMLGIEPVSHGTSENLTVRVQNDPSDKVGIEYESLSLGDEFDYNTGVVSNQFEDVLFASEAGSAFEANVRNAQDLDENEVQWSLRKLKTLKGVMQYHSLWPVLSILPVQICVR